LIFSNFKLKFNIGYFRKINKKVEIYREELL
jgi:hypothetical protein